MKQLQVFKFQLRPQSQRAGDMQRFAGACRFVFNQSPALQNENHGAGNKYFPYVKMAAWLVEWKKAPEAKWLKETPSQPLQQVLKDLEHVYQNYFQKRAAFPRFKKCGQQVEKLHVQIKHIRPDYLHKVRMTLSKNHVRTVIEDLKIANLSKSAAGTVVRCW